MRIVEHSAAVDEGYDLLFGHQNLIGSCGRMWEGGGVSEGVHEYISYWVGGRVG